MYNAQSYGQSQGKNAQMNYVRIEDYVYVRATLCLKKQTNYNFVLGTSHRNISPNKIPLIFRFQCQNPTSIWAFAHTLKLARMKVLQRKSLGMEARKREHATHIVLVTEYEKRLKQQEGATETGGQSECPGTLTEGRGWGGGGGGDVDTLTK